MNKYNIGDTLRILCADGGRSKYVGQTFVVDQIYKYSKGICYASNDLLDECVFYENEVELNESSYPFDDKLNDEPDDEAIDALIEENMILKDQLIEVQDKLLYYQDLHIEDLLELFNK